MIQIIPAKERYFNDAGWLQTFWLFSFSDYYDPENVQFGPLRVFNDDIVQSGKGFPMHPHDEMEIISIVLDGEITHEDSMGNKTVIRTGDVQRMSAGTGITHSEFNRADRPVHFYQIWIEPNQKRLKPSYDQRYLEPESWKNRLLAVASGEGISDGVTFHADGTIYRADLDEGMRIDYETKEKRKVFIYVTSGEMEVNGERIQTCDQARIERKKNVVIEANENSSFLLIDLPS